MIVPGECAVRGHRALVWNGSGPGRPLVLLHGFAGRAESFARLASKLNWSRPLVAIDLPGHGPLSPADPAGGFEGAADGVGDVLDALGLQPHDIVGYSLGARVALALLARRPDRFARAVLVGVHPGLRTPGERHERAAADARWADLLRGEGIAVFVAKWETQPLFATQRALPEVVLAAQRSLRLSHDPGRLTAALETLGLAGMPDYWPALEVIDIPVDLVVGSLDPKFREIAARALPLLRRGAVHVAGGSGHNVLLERPDALAAIVDSAT